MKYAVALMRNLRRCGMRLSSLASWADSCERRLENALEAIRIARQRARKRRSASGRETIPPETGAAFGHEARRVHEPGAAANAGTHFSHMVFHARPSAQVPRAPFLEVLAAPWTRPPREAAPARSAHFGA